MGFSWTINYLLPCVGVLTTVRIPKDLHAVENQVVETGLTGRATRGGVGSSRSNNAVFSRHSGCGSDFVERD